MTSTQQYRSLSLNYSLHPLISELNIDLLHQNPYNPVNQIFIIFQLQFIKLWAAKKLKQTYLLDQEQSDQEQIEKDFKMSIDKRLIQNTNNKIVDNKNKKISHYKRRNAVFFYPQTVENTRKQIQKGQQAKSRIMISIKNDIFFKNLNWEQISYFVQKGSLFETEDKNVVLQDINEPMKQFFVVVTGQVSRETAQRQDNKIYYSGECLCQQSFLCPMPSKFTYICRQQKTLLFCLSGFEVNRALTQINKLKYEFYLKSLLNKQELNYLDDQQKDKLIWCFKQRKQIMAGELIFIGKQQKGSQNTQNKFYIVIKGQFSKCKKNLSGELLAFKSLKPGDFFGEEALFMNADDADYSVLCLDDNSQIAYIDRTALQNSVDSYSRIVKRSKMQIRFVSS